MQAYVLTRAGSGLVPGEETTRLGERARAPEVTFSHAVIRSHEMELENITNCSGGSIGVIRELRASCDYVCGCSGKAAQGKKTQELHYNSSLDKSFSRLEPQDTLEGGRSGNLCSWQSSDIST